MQSNFFKTLDIHNLYSHHAESLISHSQEDHHVDAKNFQRSYTSHQEHR